MNVDRRAANGLINKSEPQQIQLWMSSASDKNTFCYDKAIEMMELSVINPSKCFVFGCDYFVPLQAGLLSKDYLNELKTSATFSESGFAREYMSKFVGSSSDAWFNYEKILKRRKIVNPEKNCIFIDGVDCYYIIGVDIARKGCQTVAVVLKVFPNNDYKCKLVNLFVLGKTENEKVLDKQVVALKKLIKKYNPKEVVIDINGIGVFFADQMIKETVDPDTGEVYPAYGFFNRDDYLTIQPKNVPKILFGIKANAQINSTMHTSLYTRIENGKIQFLISEQVAKNKLLATKTGIRMTPEQRNERLLPHELTSLLINELMNLKVKPAGANNLIAIEMINKRMTKDKFSALEMAVYRIDLIEKEEISHRRNRGLTRRLTFYKTGV